MLARHVNDRIEDGFEITEHITDGDDPAALTLARALNVRGVPAVYAYDWTVAVFHIHPGLPIYDDQGRGVITSSRVSKNQLTDALPKS